jgi:hypothetical protein
VNGRQISNWRFFPSTGEIQASLSFDPGTHTIEIIATNGCGRERESKTLVVEAPCIPPQVTMSISEVASENSTHLLSARLQNVSIRDNVNLLVNGTLLTNYRFNPNSGQLTANLNLDPGSHNIMVIGMNECGSNRASKTVVIKAPCQLPSVSMNISEVTRENVTHQLSASLQNIGSRSDITLKVNGTPLTDFGFNPTTGGVSANFNLDPGSHTIVLMAKNSCGTDTEAATVSVKSPCKPPTVSFNISEINSASATHRLSGRVQNVKNKGQVILKVDGRPDNRFRLVPSTGEISGSFKLAPGTHTINIRVSNECGTNSQSKQVMVAKLPVDVPDGGVNTNPNAGWVRINPGNSTWEFCLLTGRGNYTRDDLSNANFSYSGTASSLYIKPIAGGGTAIVNGKAFNLNSGQYYLFRGNLKVQVTNKRQGAMGHWSVYIESSNAPLTGKGNNRPKSPCETSNKKRTR